MRLESAIAGDVLERILSAYGFTMQKDLSDKLGIAKSNVASWLQRGQVPGNVIVQCALDTGSDVSWLVTGKLAKSNPTALQTIGQGKVLYDEIMSNGGKPVLRRIMDSYGFTLQKQLCELLAISSGTVSTWVRREYFPGDVVVTCALDTGVSLLWLATGKGERTTNEQTKPSPNKIPKFRFESGRLKNAGDWIVDSSLFNTPICVAEYIEGVKFSWLIDRSPIEIGSGKWFVEVDGAYDVFDISRLPGGKLRLKNDILVYECGISDIKPYGVVLFTLERNV
ncbi:phage repressor protein CI [Pantoea agglomerans]